MDPDDEALDGDDDKAGKERQKLIYLLAKREKDLQKKLKQLNEDVNYVMRSRLAVDGRRRRTGDVGMPVKKKGKGESILEKEEENLKKKLENYEQEIKNYKSKIEKKKEEMMKPTSNKEILTEKKNKLEKELKEIKHKIKLAETAVLSSSKEEKAKHHQNYNNDYLFKYKSRSSEKEEEGWSGKLSKDFRREMENQRRLENKIVVIKKEKMDMRIRLKKEIEFFFEKQDIINLKEGTGKD